MEQKVFTVEGMSCSHCVSAITEALTPVKGVDHVEVSLTKKTVAIDYNSNIIQPDALGALIEDCGYDVV